MTTTVTSLTNTTTVTPILTSTAVQFTPITLNNTVNQPNSTTLLPTTKPMVPDKANKQFLDEDEDVNVSKGSSLASSLSGTGATILFLLPIFYEFTQAF